MRFYSDSLGLSDSEFSLLRELIQERTGLSYADGASGTLADKLSGRVVECGFDSFLDYYYLLKYDRLADDEWRRVMDALSVPESYFWRGSDQVQALVEQIVPRHFASAAPGPLTIWCAACANGEEPLTIAIALKEAGWLGRVPIEIHASDASPAAIERARAGIYRERSFRNIPLDLRERYFGKASGADCIDPDIQAHVHWRTANLLAEDQVATLARSRVIFCRNVFIYFSDDAIRKTVDMFARHMPSPGYLFLGASESLLRVGSPFHLEEVGGAFVYVR
jgi:chemotaxis protein methyltransferase CheR